MDWSDDDDIDEALRRELEDTKRPPDRDTARLQAACDKLATQFQALLEGAVERVVERAEAKITTVLQRSIEQAALSAARTVAQSLVDGKQVRLPTVREEEGDESHSLAGRTQC